MRRYLLLSLIATVFGLPLVSSAQSDASIDVDSAIEIIRAGMQAQKATLVAQAMDLTEQDGNAFWPVYRHYQYERSRLEDGRAAVIKEYIDKFPDLSDSEARTMADRMFEYDTRTAEIKKKYFKKFNRVLPALTVTKFFQLERRIDLMTEMKIESALPPLIENKQSE